MEDTSVAERPAPRPSPTSKAIVVVEDDDDIRRILQAVLETAGYRVVTYPGVREALNQMRLDDTALILTDLAMPEQGGDKLIYRIRKNQSAAHIPIIVVTAFEADSIGYRAKVAGCDGIIHKPFRSKEILAEVSKHLQLAASRNPEIA